MVSEDVIGGIIGKTCTLLVANTVCCGGCVTIGIGSGWISVLGGGRTVSAMVFKSSSTGVKRSSKSTMSDNKTSSVRSPLSPKISEIN